MMEEIERMVALGLINQSDIERMMKRATGGTYVDEASKARIEHCIVEYNNMVDSLHQLGVISDARLDSTKAKVKKLVIAAIKDGETLAVETQTQEEE
jgi:tRNA(Ser,Leu) C12 N-acetylase TAN1